MKKLMTICVVLGLVLAATDVANADMIMYADHVTNILRGDTTIGDFAGFYGGTFPGTFPVALTEAEARAAVLGAPDGHFLSLPGDDDTPYGTGFLYAYVEVGFQDTFGATAINLYVTELGASLERAHLWVWFEGGGNVQPIIQRNGEDTIVLDLSPYASLVDTYGAFDRIGIGGLDLLGASQGFDLDAVGVTVPVPGAVLLGMLGLSLAGVKLRKHA